MSEDIVEPETLTLTEQAFEARWKQALAEGDLNVLSELLRTL